jgi:hypothetical protein
VAVEQLQVFGVEEEDVTVLRVCAEQSQSRPSSILVCVLHNNLDLGSN